MITVLKETSKNPIQLIGKVSGICYNSNTEDCKKNYKRGLDCLKNNHGRTLESVDIYLVIDNYSAKFVREFYTHIGGAPMRLQSSTRYIDYANKGLPFVTPPKIEVNPEALTIYNETVKHIQESAKKLEELGIQKEDASMLFPFCMESKFVVKCNLRMLIDMSHQRLCARAFWEYRKFMKELKEKLSEIDDEWKYIIDNYFKPKCDLIGYCPETFGCGKYPR